jgi:hypothetical protein
MSSPHWAKGGPITASVPDCGQTPLPIPDSAASASKSREVFRGLTETEQVPGPIPFATSGAVLLILVILFVWV